MSDNIISPSDARLLIHRFVTERVPVLAWFVSADQSLKVKVTGFVTGFTREVGMVICTESPATKPGTSLPAYMMFSHLAVSDSVFRYSDETELPEDFELGSGLRIDLPNGDALTLAEIRAS
jgi:hypothetical protein